MEAPVRYFILRLGTSLIQRGLSGISTGNLGKKADEFCRTLNVGVDQLRSFQESAPGMKAILGTRDSIERLAEKLCEGDWDQMSTMLNLLDQVTQGQVLVVEKERYDELEAQLPSEPEEYPHYPQL